MERRNIYVWLLVIGVMAVWMAASGAAFAQSASTQENSGSDTSVGTPARGSETSTSSPSSSSMGSSPSDSGMSSERSMSGSSSTTTTMGSGTTDQSVSSPPASPADAPMNTKDLDENRPNKEGYAGSAATGGGVVTSPTAAGQTGESGTEK